MGVEKSTYQAQLQQELEMVPAEYIPSLLKMVRAFREGVTRAPASETFEQGWREAVSGQTHPIEDLWKEDGQ